VRFDKLERHHCSPAEVDVHVLRAARDQRDHPDADYQGRSAKRHRPFAQEVKRRDSEELHHLQRFDPPLAFEDREQQMAEGTLVDYVAKELSQVMVNNQLKYETAQLLLSARGTKESGEAIVGQGRKKFTEFSLLSTKEVDEADLKAALTSIQATLAKQPLFEEVNAFDTSVANETKLSALAAILASLVMIIGYIWFRFEKVYFGYAAVAALAHDVLVTLGAIAIAAYLSKTPLGPLLFLEDFKINMGQIACLLTIVGYSLNDTIVIFDRLREIKGKSPRITYDMINLSVNQTLSRTILTALTVFIVVIVMYLAGGEGIHGFAFSMIIGVITGAYSTIYIANPVLFWLVDRESRPVKKAVA